MRGKIRFIIVALICALWTALSSADEFTGIQPAALDQPRINAYISLSAGGEPLTYEGSFNVEAFFDTGASGVLLSTNTASYLGVTSSTYNNQPVVFRDVGVAGADEFDVSTPVYISLAPYHPSTDIDNSATYQTVYNQSFGPVRTQIGPNNQVDPNPLLGDLDVFGVPLMAGKVVVMDPKPVNTFLDTMRTYVYNPGTPYNAAAADTDPGIPQVSRHIRLSMGDFSRFTETLPAGADPPTMAANPFIGPNPIAALNPNAPPDNTPPITVSYNGKTSTGSWLLDTGAAASMISTAQAAKLGVTYDPSTVGTDSPVLLGVPQDQQFTLTIGGIGGTTKVAGFFLDTMLVKTMEGDPNNDSDPNHLLFRNAPVLVNDITVKDPASGQTLTLDGIFGMNNLVASAYVSEGAAGSFPTIGALSFGKFDWIVFDPQNKTLGLQPSAAQSQDSISWFGDFMGGQSDWDTTSENWLSGGSLATYQDGDHVVFSDNTFDDKVHITEPVAPASIEFTNTGGDMGVNYSIYGQPIQGFTNVTKTGAGMVTFYNSNTYKGSTDIYAGEIVFAAPQDIGPVNVYSGGAVSMTTSQRFQSLHIGDGGQGYIQQNGSLMLVVNDLVIEGTGKFDLYDNAMVIHAAADTRDEVLARIGGYIRSAMGSDRSWTGPGLTSSAAQTDPIRGIAAIANEKLDAGGNMVPLMSTFNGEPVDINSVLVKYTLNGDTNLDGIINFDDYYQINTGFLSNGKLTGYRWGDFNYDGIINFDDYYLINTAFLGQGAGGAAQPTVVVPEPSAVMIVFAALVLARRGRRGLRR